MEGWISSLVGSTRARTTRRFQGFFFVAILLGPTCCPAQSLLFSSGGGAKTLTVTSAIAGYEPDEVTDDSAELTWDATGIGSTAKITVNTSAPGQSFSLFVSLAVTVGVGTEQPERELTDGMGDADLLRDIPTLAPIGVGSLTYRATATTSQGNSNDNGTDVHSITYTILAQ